MSPPPVNMRAWKNCPSISSPYESVYFSSMFFKFCALDRLLRAWEFACARKIFSAHYILSSLAIKKRRFRLYFKNILLLACWHRRNNLLVEKFQLECDQLHAFFYKEPTSRPGSKSSLFIDLKSANCSTKSSLIVP